jgi:hypothetical protein
MMNGITRAAMLAGAATLLVAPLGAQEEERYGYIGTSLFGDQEVDTEGAGEDASADFMAEFDYQQGRVCYMLEMDGLKDFTAAHIHKGKLGENGPPVMTLELSTDGEDVCQDADVALMKEIAANEADYYVNLHTKRYPNGAVRGQLGQDD